MAGVQLVQKGPFKFTYADYAALLAGVDLWTAAGGDAPQLIGVSVPVTPFVGANDTQATVTADSAPPLPVTIVTGVNDTFVLTGEGGAGSPETFTMANGATATTLADLETIAEAATGSVSSEPFSTYVTVTDNGTNLVFSMVAGGPALGQNGNTITEGDGGAAALGIDSPPASFSGGAGPILEVTFGTPIAGLGTIDLSGIDSNKGGYGDLVYMGTSGNTAGPLATDNFLYAPASAAGIEYVAKFVSDPGALTQGECYIYALLYPELIQTT